MLYRSNAGGTHYVFDDLAATLARASPDRAGEGSPGLRRKAAKSASRHAWRWPICHLRAFSTRPSVPYEMDEVTRLVLDTHDKRAFCPNRRHDRRGFSRFSFIRRSDGRIARPPGAGHHAGNGGGGVETLRNQDLIAMLRKRFRRDAVSHHYRLAGASLRAYPAQSPRMISPASRGHSRWTHVWLRRCLCRDSIRPRIVNQADAAAS